MQKNEIIAFLASSKSELQKKFGVNRIGLCGSYARDENRPNSDIDLVIEIESEKKDIHTFLALKRMLEAKLGTKVDIGFEHMIKPAAREKILKEIIYV